MSYIIKLDDLRHAIARAVDLGRYTVQFGTEPVSGGVEVVPASITLDLRERDDDGFLDLPSLADLMRGQIGKGRPFPDPTITPEGEALVNTVHDDQGPAIPAQPVWTGLDIGAGRDVSVYEFALQDVKRTPAEVRLDWTLKLADIVEADAPDYEAAHAADWVHVYDRVTRERRTLKRPEPDRILTGLRDVAADLRGKSWPQPGDQVLYWPKHYDRPSGVWRDGAGGTPWIGKVESVTDGGAMISWRHGESFLPVSSAPVESLRPLSDWTPRGAPVEPPFGCAALPPVGPLTSTEGLKPGDVLLSLEHKRPHRETGDIITVQDRDGRDYGDVWYRSRDGVEVHGVHKSFAFVGRPGADGWMNWAGGENPVPGAVVEYRLRDGTTRIGSADKQQRFNMWQHLPHEPDSDIVAFRIVDTSPASSDT